MTAETVRSPHQMAADSASVPAACCTLSRAELPVTPDRHQNTWRIGPRRHENPQILFGSPSGFACHANRAGKEELAPPAMLDDLAESILQVM